MSFVCEFDFLPMVEHYDIRTAHMVIDCLMVEADRGGVTITGADVSTFESGGVNVHLRSDDAFCLAEIVGLGEPRYLAHTPGGLTSTVVIASYECRIGRWSFSLTYCVGTVVTHGHLIDDEEA